METTRNPLLVLISDVHFNINTLEKASKALFLAVDKANELDVPLCIAGDLHDTKANMRAECVKTIKKILQRAHQKPIILIGNHDLVNEKGPVTENALTFLEDKNLVVSKPIETRGLIFFPYFNNVNKLREELGFTSISSVIIMHQGLNGSNSGDYFQDHSALNVGDVPGKRIISGHYHKRQHIELPDGGKWTFLGNPYTLGYGEADHGPKGMHVLYDNGDLEFIEIKLPYHRVFEIQFLGDGDIINSVEYVDFGPDDPVWFKAYGSPEELKVVTKDWVRDEYGLLQNPLRLDLIRTDEAEIQQVDRKNLSQPELLDSIIENIGNKTASEKEYLKKLWRELAGL